MSRPYTLHVIKKHSTKTDAELEELKLKYKDGVPDELIDHIADKLAGIIVCDDDDMGVKVVK